MTQKKTLKTSAKAAEEKKAVKKVAAKVETKEVAKPATKASATKTVKTVTKPAAKAATKPATKAVAKPATKAVAKSETKESAKPAVKKAPAKKAVAPKVVKKTVQDYIDVINWKKWEAHNMDWLYIEINAGDLLTELEAGVSNITTASKAILECMLEGDEFIFEPKTKTKASEKLTVRYYCDNLSETRQKYQG